jgi:hypothetical protein
MESFYNSIWARIGSQQDFPNTCDCNINEDNGAGLSWNAILIGGLTQTFSHHTVFTTRRAMGTFGGKWPYTGNSVQLGWSYPGGHRYLGNVFQAGTNWNDIGTKVHLTQWHPPLVAPQITVYDRNSNDTYWGITIPANLCYSCTYSNTSIYLVQGTMDRLGDFMRTKVSTHEIGHALGLAHPIESGLVVGSIMNQGNLLYNKPQPFDTSTLNGLYP